MIEENKYLIISLPDDLKKEIETLVGPRNLSTFIAEAAEREVVRRNKAVLRTMQIQVQERVFIN